jgi:hypothetical protein
MARDTEGRSPSGQLNLVAGSAGTWLGRSEATDAGLAVG